MGVSIGDPIMQWIYNQWFLNQVPALRIARPESGCRVRRSYARDGIREGDVICHLDPEW